MTIAQQLKVTEFPFVIKDAKGNEIYWEDSKGYWVRLEFDSTNMEIYREQSDGFWTRREYNSLGKEVYYENSRGLILDRRSKPVTELTLDQIAEKFGVDVNNLKIKK